MNNLDNLKFVTEDDKEYVILTNKFIENVYYGYAVNLNNESDALYVKIQKDQNGYFFEIIDDINIIKKIIEN